MNAIHLRKAKVSDAEALYQVIDESREHLTNLVWAADATLESTREFLANVSKFGERFRLIEVDGKIVGTITLRFHKLVNTWLIGYWLSHNARGKGIMKEAVRQMVEPQTLAMVIYATVRNKNMASQKILLANHFQVVSQDDEWTTLVRYSR